MRVVTAREQVAMLTPWRRTAVKAQFAPGPHEHSAVIATDDGPLAMLEWHPKTKEVDWINTHPMYRRQGLATGLFNWAKQNMEPDLQHSRHVTPNGKAWSRSMGYSPPKGMGWHMVPPNG